LVSQQSQLVGTIARAHGEILKSGARRGERDFGSQARGSRHYKAQLRFPDLNLTFWSHCDHSIVMKSVSVAQLKSKLSQYLAAVKNGKEIVVTSHRHPIARIIPMETTAADDLQIIPARKPVSSLREIKGIKLSFDPVECLLEDRRRR
jgi:prevent-host-death family protein